MIKAMLAGKSPLDAYVAAVLAKGPSMFLKMQESSGNLADATGNGNNGVATSGTPTYGEPGPAHGVNAVGFDGACHFVVGDTASFSASTSAFTVEVWVKATTAATQSVIQKTNGTLEQWALTLPASNHYFQIKNTLNNGYLDAFALGSQTGGWQHLVGVCDGATGPARLYLDGVEVSTDSTTTGTRRGAAGYPILIGRRSSGVQQLTGLVTMVAFYPRALSAAEIVENRSIMLGN